jgi:hypothetical protein
MIGPAATSRGISSPAAPWAAKIHQGRAVLARVMLSRSAMIRAKAYPAITPGTSASSHAATATTATSAR